MNPAPRVVLIKAIVPGAAPVSLESSLVRVDEPTPAQAAAGRYPKRAMPWNGLTIRIENEAGSVRRGTKPDGSPWETRMAFPYGEIARTEGVDGDPVDVFVGPFAETAETVFVVHQRRVDDWRKFDEDKCMVGWLTEDEAKAAFLQCYDDPRFLGPITAMPVAEFIEKVKATREAPKMIKSRVVFVKSHIDAYTKKDGTFVQAHEDKRVAFPSRDEWAKMHPITRKDGKWHLLGRDGETIASHMSDAVLDDQRHAEYFRQKKLHAEGAADKPKPVENTTSRKKNLSGKFVHDPVSGFDWPSNGKEPKILFHNSQNDKEGFEIKNDGVYGGIFVGPHAGMDLGYKHAVILDTDSHAEHHDLKNFSEKRLDAAVKMIFPQLSKKQRYKALDYLFEEKNGLEDEEGGKLVELFGTSDPHYIYNKLQALRGKLAVELGFKSVDMKDETGVSTFVAPGGKTYALVDGESFDQAEARIYAAWKDWRENRYVSDAAPKMIKAVRVGPYIRRGKLVNIHGYDSKGARSKPGDAQLSLLYLLDKPAPAAPAAPVRQTDTEAFKRWFGDSKVVDAEGKPLVVYKGGRTESWRDDSPLFEFRSSNGPWAGFFTDSKDVANRFAELTHGWTKGRAPSGVFPVYLSLQNPLIVDAGGKKARYFQIDASIIGKEDHPIRQELLSGKYDGLILNNTEDEGTVFVALYPNQIKSAIGNNGEFSRESNVITKSAGDAPILFIKAIDKRDTHTQDMFASPGTHMETITRKDGVVQRHVVANAAAAPKVDVAKMDEIQAKRKLVEKRDTLQDFLETRPDSPNAGVWRQQIADIDAQIGPKAVEKKEGRKDPDMSGWSEPQKTAYALRKEYENVWMYASAKELGEFKRKIRRVAKTIPENDDKAVFYIDHLVNRVWGSTYDPKRADVEFAKPATVTEPRSELIAEHKRLVSVLESPSHAEDKKLAERLEGARDPEPEEDHHMIAHMARNLSGKAQKLGDLIAPLKNINRDWQQEKAMRDPAFDLAYRAHYTDARLLHEKIKDLAEKYPKLKIMEKIAGQEAMRLISYYASHRYYEPDEYTLRNMIEDSKPYLKVAKPQKTPTKPDGRITSDSNLADGTTIKDGKGKLYRVHYQRNHLVLAHPIENGKAQVSADTGVRFWVAPDRLPSGDDDRTDPIYPVTEKAPPEKKLGTKAKRALEILQAGGYFRKQLESQYRGGEKFETRLRDKSGAIVQGIGIKTFFELQSAGYLASRPVERSTVWPSEWGVRETPLAKSIAPRVTSVRKLS